MTGDSLSQPSALTIRTLRRNPALAPTGGESDRFYKTFLPLVYGSASALLPDHPDSISGIVEAVFQTFLRRWRKLPKRTFVATWLLQSTFYAVSRERARLKLPLPQPSSTANTVCLLLKRLIRLPSVIFNVLVLHVMLKRSIQETAQALHRKETRIAKLKDRGLTKLAKVLRKKRLQGEPQTLLASLCAMPSEQWENLLPSLCSGSCPQPAQSNRVREIMRSWQWFGLKRALRRMAATVLVILGLLALCIGTVVWLATQGYLTEWLIQFAGRQLTKEIPALTQPARPWPEASNRLVHAMSPPKTSAELYGLTNIWITKLSFTAQQWREIAPSRVRPVLNLMNPDGTMTLRNPNARRSGLAGVIGLDFNWTTARLDFAGLTYSNVAVRYRGNGTYVNSLYGPKQSFKVDLNRYEKGQKLAGMSALNFVNAIPDNSYLHDALAQQLFRAMGVPGPRTAYAYLAVDVPGKFASQALGLYVLIENIDSAFAFDRFGSKDTPIFKPVTPELFKDLGDHWKAYADTYDLKTKATPQQWQKLIDFARLITHAADAEFEQRLAEFLDLDEFAAFVAGHVLLSSYDGFLANGQNYYLYLHPTANRFGFIPWDQDHAWGEFGYVATADRRERASIWKPSAYRNRFLERVMKVKAFKEVYQHHLEQALAREFSIEQLYPQIDRLASMIRPAIAAESGFRLQRFDLAVSTNWLSGPRDGAPEGPKAPVHQIKRFIANRVKSVRDQLEGRAVGEILNFGERR